LHDAIYCIIIIYKYKKKIGDAHVKNSISHILFLCAFLVGCGEEKQKLSEYDYFIRAKGFEISEVQKDGSFYLTLKGIRSGDTINAFPTIGHKGGVHLVSSKALVENLKTLPKNDEGFISQKPHNFLAFVTKDEKEAILFVSIRGVKDFSDDSIKFSVRLMKDENALLDGERVSLKEISKETPLHRVEFLVDGIASTLRNCRRHGGC
jgi:hypothetical protein